jgi:predicted PurR-regulated permease PerM
MGYWARAQFLIALSFALLMGGWLFLLGVPSPFALLGVPSPFALGLLGGLLEVIPFVGGITTALLASLLALSSKGALTALLVLAGYGGIALLEGKLLIPLIYGRTLGFHPALVLLAIFAFGKLFGLLGVFLAVPMTILLSGLLRHWRG